jgi:uncharacterized coiled-coil protein SlyX
MSDVVDLTMISGAVLEVTRDVRLMRLQLDALAARLSGHDGRFGGIDGRLAALEQSFHDLTNETARGFGQMQQQFARQEQRLNALDAGLGKLSADLAASTERIIREIAARSR